MANAHQAITYPVRSLDGRFTLEVKVVLTRELKVRAWLGTQLIKLAARVMGCGIEILEREKNDG